jgi:mono/diheme cytochrome c family protein
VAGRRRLSTQAIRLGASGLVLVALVALNVLAGHAGHDPAGAVGGEGAPPAGSGPSGSNVQRGYALFLAKGCAGCHMLRGVEGGASIGPDLTPLPQVARTRWAGVGAEEYVRESIVAPDAYLVPGFGGVGGTRMPSIALSDADVQALVAFLLTPGGGW